ncbi:MAG TPA: hypothetical protein VGA20_05080, partial [Gemmatimonadales bacterium]
MLGLAQVRKLWSWLIPEGIILGAAITALEADRMRQTVHALAQVYPYVVVALGILLALRFQRSRLVFALLVLGLAEWVLRQTPVGPAGRFLFQATAFLVPLNLAAITLMTERGTFTRMGLLRLGLLFVQVGAVLAVLKFAPHRGVAVATLRVLPAEWFAWTPLTQLPVFASIAAFALTVMGLVFQATPTGRAFLWALVAA